MDIERFDETEFNIEECPGKGNKMASIDKIYGTLNQRIELAVWLGNNNPDALKYLYDWNQEWIFDGKDHPISNFPEEIDKWLLENCTINWVVERIKEQYNL